MVARIPRSRPCCRRGLAVDARGSTLALFAAFAFPLLGLAGTGVDLGRAYMVRARLQSAADAAALAAVRTEQIYPGSANRAGPRTAKAIDAMIAANLPVGYMGTPKSASTFTVSRANEEVTVDLSALVTVPTSVMRMFGYGAVPVRVTARAVGGRTLPHAVETLLVLDNTGSMDANGGMVALRQSVSDFLDVVFGTRETRKNFAIGVLPYSVMVNVGRLLPQAMVEPLAGFTDRPANDPAGWKGCVFADPTRRDLSSDTNMIDSGAWDMGKGLPGEDSMARVRPFIYPPLPVRSFRRQDNRYRLPGSDADARSLANYPPMRAALVRHYGANICHDGSDGRLPRDCAAPGAIVDPALIAGYAGWPAARPYRSDVKPIDGDGVLVSSPNYLCPSEALPISYGHTKSRLKAYVETENQPLFNIGTWHNPAMTWGYRLLARDDVFPRSRPSDIGLRRVLIFMTDGNFDSVDEGSTNPNRGGGHGSFQRDTAYTAYQSYADKLLVDRDWPSGNAGTQAARAAHRDATALRFAKTCQAMKQEGIEIYTITFAISAGSEADMTRRMFKRCASDPNTHFFETQDAGELRAAFSTIGAELVDLHLVK